MIGSYRNFLRIVINFFFNFIFSITWTLSKFNFWWLLLCWLRTLIFLFRLNRFSFSFLCRYFSFGFICISTNLDLLSSVFWCWIYVSRSFYKPTSLFIKYVRYKCSSSFFLLWLFFNNFNMRMHRFIFFFVS